MLHRSGKSTRVLALSLLLTPWLAQAHSGSHGASFAHGVAHPLAGLDHVCAMLAVGLWAAQRGGRAIWIMPLSFVSMMLAGGTLASFGIVLPMVETGIALSVLCLGLLVSAAVRMPMWSSSAVAGLFAILHGHAHAMELPMNALALPYSAGFAVSTVALHLVGIGFGLAVARLGKVAAVRIAGGAIALCGVFLLALP